MVHTVRGTSGNIHDVTKGNSLLHGQECLAFGDAGSQCIPKRPDAHVDDTWHVCMPPDKRRTLNMDNAANVLNDQAEKIKVGIRAKEEHSPTCDAFALSNFWMERGLQMGT